MAFAGAGDRRVAGGGDSRGGGRAADRPAVGARPGVRSAGSGNGRSARLVRTNVYGAFEFPPLAAGAYLVSAARRAFAPLQYGQKRWKAAGVPVVLDADGAAVLTLRLQRFGSIAGTVVDENEVGLPKHEVLAYRNTRPPQLVAHATTDDRGMYRLWGLEPGSYLVRTSAKKSQEDSYLPTFARESARLEDARGIDVELDRQTDDISVRPFPGRLCTVAGQALTSPQVPATVTLVSDMGTQTATTDASGNFHFDSVAPGLYEIYAQAQGDRRTGGGVQAGFAPLVVDREATEVRVRLGSLADLQILVEDSNGKPVDFALFQVMSRHKDLSGDGKSEALRLQQGHASLLPGRWDLSLLTTAGYYVAKFIGPRGAVSDQARADGWNEIVAPNGPIDVRFVLSPNPGLVRGAVTGVNHEPAAGAPVYLESYDPKNQRRLTDLRQTRTDLQGHYEFYGLPPGSYRILSTFEYQSPDVAAMAAAGAQTIQVEEARETAVDLTLYVLQ